MKYIVFWILLFAVIFLLVRIFILWQKKKVYGAQAVSFMALKILRDFSQSGQSTPSSADVFCFDESDALVQYILSYKFYSIRNPKTHARLYQDKMENKYNSQKFNLGYLAILHGLLELYNSTNRNAPLEDKYRGIYLLCVEKLFGKESKYLSLADSFCMETTRILLAEAIAF